jgi:signal transduction histidine kinase
MAAVHAPAAPPPAAAEPPRTPWQLAMGFVLLYALLDWVSFVHPMRGTNITPWNPQAALAVALLTRHPRMAWVVALAIAGTDLLRGLPQPPLADLVASTLLTLGYMATAAALRRWLGPLPRVATRRDFVAFGLITAAGAALDTVIYVGAMSLLGFGAADRLGYATLRAWTGDVVSLVVMLPVVFALADKRRREAAAAMLRSTEWWLIGVAACGVALLVFAQPPDEQFKLFYLFFLPVSWAAARFGNPGAVWGAAGVQLLLITAVQASPYRPATVFELHLVMTMLGATGLLLGTTVEEREQAELALRESLHAAAAADMAAALAHELNQPLTAMRTYARACQVLAQREPVPAGEAEAAPPGAGSLPEVTDKLMAEVTRAGAVVRRLRDFFKQGQTQLQLADLGVLADEALATQQAHAAAGGVTLRRDDEAGVPTSTRPPEPWLVWIDAVQIGVVLRNLLSNAIDAASELPHGEVVLRLVRQGDELLVSVLDNGPGVAPEELARLFDARTSRKPQGMGIGLAISRSIVHAHDGRLWAEAGPGGRFHMALPLAQDDEHDDRDERDAQGEDGHG